MTQVPHLKIAKSDPDAVVPELATPGSAGADLKAMIRNDRGAVIEEGITLQPLQRHLFDTGLRMDIPEGFEIQIRPRSGLALKHGLTVLNTPGTIDSDYKGPIKVLLVLLGSEPYTIHHKDRIAQMVVARTCMFRSTLVTRIGESERGMGGFGSTGK